MKPLSGPLDDVLGDADRAPLASGSLRTASGLSALRRIWRSRVLLGITRVTDITELDVLGVPVIAAVRPLVDRLQITATQGKGLTGLVALVSALYEGLERHSAALGAPCFAATPDELAGAGHAVLAPAAVFAEPGAKLEWSRARSLFSGDDLLIPAAAARFPYRPPEGYALPLRPATTGFASGSTPAEAMLHALFEVVERDAVSAFVRGAAGRLVDPSTLDGTELSLAQRFADAGADLLIADLSHLAVLPTYFVASTGPRRRGLFPELPMAGQGTHLSARHALRRALLEAAQTRAVAIQGSREDLARHASDWTAADGREEWERLRASLDGHADAPPAAPFTGSIADALVTTLNKLAEGGADELLVTQLPTPVPSTSVCHVLAAGLRDRIANRTDLQWTRGNGA